MSETAPRNIHRGARGSVKKKKRSRKDFYATNVLDAIAMCRHVESRISLTSVAAVAGRAPRIVEPSAGTGKFVRAIRTVWPNAEIFVIEKYGSLARNRARLKAAGCTRGAHAGWEDPEVDRLVREFDPDLIIGNPPFFLAVAHALIALDRLQRRANLAFLLGSSFLAGQDRARTIWAPNPCEGLGELRSAALFGRRPSFFASGKTDMAEYCCFLWEKGYSGPTILLPHIWRNDADTIPAAAATPGEPLTRSEEHADASREGGDPAHSGERPAEPAAA